MPALVLVRDRECNPAIVRIVWKHKQQPALAGSVGASLLATEGTLGVATP